MRVRRSALPVAAALGATLLALPATVAVAREVDVALVPPPSSGTDLPSDLPDDLPIELPGDAPEDQRASGPFAGASLYVAPGSHYEQQAAAWRTSDPEGARIMDEMAQAPLAVWLGEWLDPRATVDAALDAAGGQLRTFVVYAIPNRDCGAWSAGGAGSAEAYAGFVAGVAAGLEGRQAIVVLEPDGLPLTHCLDAAGVEERYAMLGDAVDTLTAAGASVYLDAGDSNWIPAEDMAQRLLAAGVERAAGFSLNVSHTELEANEIAYADRIRAIVGEGAHFVIDSSRSGIGPAPDNEWCNPPGRALGSMPTVETSHEGLDALLWIKPPGESDGSCNGGPQAGAWWPEYARGLGVEAGI